MEVNNTAKCVMVIMVLLAMGLMINEVIKLFSNHKVPGNPGMSTSTIQPTSAGSSGQPQCFTLVDVAQDLQPPKNCNIPLNLTRLLEEICKNSDADCDACGKILNMTKIKTSNGRQENIKCCERALICNKTSKCIHGKLECFDNDQRPCCKCQKGYGGETCDQCGETRMVACKCFESGRFPAKSCGDVYFNNTEDVNCSTSHQHNSVEMTCVCDNTKSLVTQDPKARTIPQCSGDPVRPCEVSETEKTTRH